MLTMNVPEIQRTNLANVVLLLKSLKVRAPAGCVMGGDVFCQANDKSRSGLGGDVYYGSRCPCLLQLLAPAASWPAWDCRTR